MKSLSIVVYSCDKYSDTWHPFFTLLQRHWGSIDVPIYLVSETKQTSFSGLDIKCINIDYPKGNPSWSVMTINSLDKIDSEFIIVMLDDFWLTKDIDCNRLNRYYDYIASSSDIGFICLRAEVEKKRFCYEQVIANTLDCEFPDLIECGKHMPYRITTQAGIWRKSFLKRILRSHESVWEFEWWGTWRSQFFKQRIFDVKETLIYYPHGGVLGGGRVVSDYLDMFDDDLIGPLILSRGTICTSEFRIPKSRKNIRHYYSRLLSVLPW